MYMRIVLWNKLKTKIVSYYKYHEIAVETPDYFIHIFHRDIENLYKIWEMAKLLIVKKMTILDFALFFLYYY